MSRQRERAFALVRDNLGTQNLVWVGIHGSEATSLLQLPQFSHCFSFGGPLGRGVATDFSVEMLLGLRKLEQSGWAYQKANQALGLEMKRACAESATVLSFGPHPFLDDLAAKSPTTWHLGGTWNAFKFFNTKTNVEEGLRDVEGIKLVPWQRLPNDERRIQLVRDELRKHPVMLRTSFSQAGVGHELIPDMDALAVSRLISAESLAVGPYLEDHIPLAVTACVFGDGSVTMHSPSVQLIGIRECTNAHFGYSGNDYAIVRQLDDRLIEKLEGCVRAAGRWLHSRGYLGVFGVDAMVFEDEVFFTEINPRFLGSSFLTAQMDAEIGAPDILMEHCMAWLGLEPTPSPPLVELAQNQPQRAQIRLYNKVEQRVHVQPEVARLPAGASLQLAPASHVRVETNDLMFALVVNESVTTNGRSLTPAASAYVEGAMQAVEAKSGRFRAKPTQPFDYARLRR